MAKMCVAVPTLWTCLASWIRMHKAWGGLQAQEARQWAIWQTRPVCSLCLSTKMCDFNPQLQQHFLLAFFLRLSFSSGCRTPWATGTFMAIPMKSSWILVALRALVSTKTAPCWWAYDSPVAKLTSRWSSKSHLLPAIPRAMFGSPWSCNSRTQLCTALKLSMDVIS